MITFVDPARQDLWVLIVMMVASAILVILLVLLILWAASVLYDIIY